jgi:hypothetical protein
MDAILDLRSGFFGCIQGSITIGLWSIDKKYEVRS